VRRAARYPARAGPDAGRRSARLAELYLRQPGGPIGTRLAESLRALGPVGRIIIGSTQDQRTRLDAGVAGCAV
jgi:hypothetical protein